MALVQPCLDYCIMSWYIGLSNKLRGKLDVLLRKMVRFVYGWGPRTHVGTGTLRELGWLQVADRARYFALVHAFRIRKGLAPSYLCKGFVQVSGVHGHQTRGSAFDFHLSASDSPGSFSYYSKCQWNDLPAQLKCIDSLAVFKVKLKQHLMATY